MIKLEHIVLASPEQMEFIIEGMRNPMNSCEKSDSGIGCDGDICKTCVFKTRFVWKYPNRSNRSKRPFSNEALI